MSVKLNEWVRVAYIDVDAGVVWVGDPCYSLTAESQYTPKTWHEFCCQTFDEESTVAKGVNAPLKNRGLYDEGLGIEISSGYGDGTYPVYVKYMKDDLFGDDRDIRVKAVLIDFLGELEDTLEDD